MNDAFSIIWSLSRFTGNRDAMFQSRAVDKFETGDLLFIMTVFLVIMRIFWFMFISLVIMIIFNDARLTNFTI